MSDKMKAELRKIKPRKDEKPTDMNPRKRVALVLEHKEPDRIPMDFGGTGVTGASKEMMERIRNCLGIAQDNDPQFPYFDNAIQKYFDIDFRQINLKSLKPQIDKDGREIDEWGVANYTDGADNPLRNINREDLKKYPWPDPYDPRRVEGLRDYAKYLYHNTDYVLVGQHYMHGLVEGGCRLRGYEQFLIDLALNPDWIKEFFDIMLDLHKKFIEIYLGEIGEYIDVTWIGDDACTQKGPYMSPRMYRELVKPYFKEIVNTIKQKTRAKVMLHCCGSCSRLIPEYLDAGIDILNPVQPEALEMEIEQLKGKHGDRLSFWGGIGLQQVLSRGTTTEVEQVVKDTVNVLGRGGGYVLAAAHSLPDDVPPENVITMFETGKKMTYPLHS